MKKLTIWLGLGVLTIATTWVFAGPSGNGPFPVIQVVQNATNGITVTGGFGTNTTLFNPSFNGTISGTATFPSTQLSGVLNIVSGTGNATFGYTQNPSLIGVCGPNTNQDNLGPSFIGGGVANYIDPNSHWCAIMGGEYNVISNCAESFIGCNDALGADRGPYINGGIYSSDECFIGGGIQNTILDGSQWSVICGGQTSVIGGECYGTFIGSGDHLQIGERVDAISPQNPGGDSLTANCHYAVICGGEDNVIRGGTRSDVRPYTMILGGYRNWIDGVGGYNAIIGWWVTNTTIRSVSIGWSNTCVTIYSNGLVDMPGGFASHATNTYSMTSTGYTNSGNKNVIVMGFTGTSVTYKNMNSGSSALLGSPSVATEILKPNCALVGTSCTAALIEDE